ncbi:peptidoglycan-binding protein [Jatrophihabitans sp. DSM 45814]
MTTSSGTAASSSDGGISFFGDWPEQPERLEQPVADRSAAHGFAQNSSAANSTTENRSVAAQEVEPPRRTHRAKKLAAAAVALAAAGTATMVALPMGSASADPSASAWLRLRQCESSNNYSINTGNAHYGAYQFDLATWRSVGGSGYPNNASPAEQDARALILYRQRGWQPWQCASIVGLREDGDARSGRISDIKVSGSRAASGVSTSIPAFPGPRWFHYGDWNSTIKRFQDQMHARGFFPVGTGQYGPNTLAMVKRLQSQNGLVPNGEIGPNTWRLAWTGKYSVASTVAAKAPVIPAFPGPRWFHYGDWNSTIKRFQDQMHARGFFPVGTGQYGPNTLAMVKRLQSQNGLVPNGEIGPNTWRLAWTGKYRPA